MYLSVCLSVLHTDIFKCKFLLGYNFPKYTGIFLAENSIYKCYRFHSLLPISAMTESLWMDHAISVLLISYSQNNKAESRIREQIGSKGTQNKLID